MDTPPSLDWRLKVSAALDCGRLLMEAVVAVARKLAVLLHRLWETGEIYDPLRNARLRGEIEPVI